MEEATDLRDGLRGVVPSGKVEAIASYIEGMGALGSRWMIVLMPFGGFGLFVLYGLQRRSYTAHFVLAIHVFCVVVLLLAVRRLVQLGVLLATGQTLVQISEVANTLMLLALFGVSYVFAALAIRRFYGVGLGRALASAPAVTVGPIAVWAGILATGMVLLMAWPA